MAVLLCALHMCVCVCVRAYLLYIYVALYINLDDGYRTGLRNVYFGQ